MKQILLLLLALAILTPSVLAADWVAKFTVDKVENVNGAKTWASSQTFILNKTETKDYLGMATIQYFDLDTTSSPMRISIRTTGGVTNSFVISNGETKNIRGSYYDNNASLSAIDDIRIKMIELNPYTVTTINSTSDNPVYAYFYTDREWSLRKDDSITFDAKAQKASSDSGVSYSGSSTLKEIYVYFKRLQTIPISITVSSKYEPSRTWDNEKIQFKIDKSDTYVFTVKYDVTNPWGASTETINKYTFIVKGLESTTSTQIYSTTPYDVYVGDTKTVSMTEAGTFSSVNGATITPLSNNTYNFIFSVAGTYNLVYTTSSGQTTVSFNVIQKPSVVVTPPPASATVVSGAQKQQTGEGGILGIDNTWLGLGLVGLVLGIIYMRKNKGSGGGHYEARKQTG